MDNPTWRNGPDQRVPPREERSKRVSPKVAETQPPLHPPARGGKYFLSPRAGRAGEGLDPGRGTLVVPAEVQWVIQRCAADLTGRSLQKADPTSGALRGGSHFSRKGKSRFAPA